MSKKKNSIRWRWLFPAHCPLCDSILTRQERMLCRACRQSVSCSGYLLPDGVAPFLYQGIYREAVHRFKYGGRAEYAPFFAAAILTVCRDRLVQWKPDVIIPVPIHRKRMLERGYNQAEELARCLAEELQIRCDNRLVVRQRNTHPQNDLTPEERQRNVADAFAIRKGAAVPKRILLVDDIYTTGSTIAEIRRLLQTHGADRIPAVCICRAGKDDRARE